ncbi:RING-H2 finger protein ATL70-like [Abrus precatorius]|uniref:RING-H2 finger protein ATL70-like n=1 Tax=Abrus precatorius TaxID=3816 RepID=A0A8B8MGH3_ABRPR|nr:RING-H2 finger protein ATL70-like [Abrus precatorius]
MNRTSNSDDPSDASNAYAYFSIGLSLGFLLLMMFIVLTTYYCSQRNLRNSQSRARATASSFSSSHRTVVMDSDHRAITIQVGEEELDAILNNYPMLLFSQAKLHKPDSTPLGCSICLADYKDSEWLRLLPDCGHFFHKECIDMWLRLNLTCPMCRNSPFQTPLPTPLAEVTPLATRRD